MEPALFCKIVNEAFELKGEHRVTAQKLAGSDSGPRQVKQAEAYFRLLPESVPTFSHFRPADWLIRNPSALDGKGADILKSLERAESIFDKYNKMLG